MHRDTIASVPARFPWQRVVPVALACILLLGMVAYTWESVQYYTQGVFTYALDDAYIHMALAKNVALHGVMGATPFEHASASSSPLWTLLLSIAFAVFGVRDITPLVLTTIASLGLIAVCDYVLLRFKISGVWRFLALAWICIATPLIAIIYGGMEHPLQILVNVALVYASVRILSRSAMRWDRLAYGALFLGAAATAVRYEGAALIAVIAVAAALRKRWKFAFAIAGAGAAPIVAYGLYSLSQGAFFLPNPVLVKSADSLFDVLLTGGFAAYVTSFRSQVQVAYPLYIMLAASAALLVAQPREEATRWSPIVVFPGIAIAVTAIHLMFGQVGWFFRYEDYMMVLMGMALVIQVRHAIPVARVARTEPVSSAVVWILAFALAGGGVVAGLSRGRVAWVSTPRASENVYEQMYQTAHFLKANPQYDSVAVGDLGAVAYFNDDLRILDLEGLAETGVPLESLGRDRASAAEIAALAKKDGVDIAIVFPEYFDLPQDWVEVARWHISNNIVAYADTVAFIAIPPTDPVELAEAVRAYTMQQLPPTVGAEGIPIETTP